jgi:putative flippase GtrA
MGAMTVPSRVVFVPKNYREFVAWSKTHQGKKLIRYTLTSVITTGVSLVAILVTYGFHIIPGVFGATLFGNVLAIFPSYYLNRVWAWGKRGKSHFRNEVVPYWSMAFLGIAFSLLGALWVKHLVHTHQWSHLVDTGLVAGVNLLCFAIFWVLKMLVFNKIFHTDKLRDIEVHLEHEEGRGSVR